VVEISTITLISYEPLRKILREIVLREIFLYTVEPIPDGAYLTVTFDVGLPAGTRARNILEAPSDLLYRLKILNLKTPVEARGRIYVLIDGVERLVAELDEDREGEIDVDEQYGNLYVEKLILEAETKTETTAPRSVTLNYAGSLVKKFK